MNKEGHVHLLLSNQNTPALDILFNGTNKFPSLPLNIWLGMDRRRLVIATITLARNNQEEQLLKESVAILAAFDLPVYVTDGGSGKSFLQFMEKFSNIHLLPPLKGVWMQAKQSISAAANTGKEFIFYTEPDKQEFFKHSLSSMLNDLEVDDKTGVILASRSAEAFNSFPLFQQMTEQTINNCCREIIGFETDYVYGPFLLNSKLIQHLNDLPKDIDWGWRPYAFNIANRLNYDLQSFTGDFYCPVDQRQDDAKERLYRIRQLQQNMQGLLLSSVAILE